MKIFRILFIVFLISVSTTAQVVEKDTTKMGFDLNGMTIDTLSNVPIELEEIIVHKENLSPEEKKQFQLLQNRVYKVYPYAKIAAERLTALNKNMDALKTSKEKKKYFKIVENYMENEFEAQLKKLSRKQGQILVKLIHRQTGQTTFQLIKDLKSGWKAFWSNNTAKLFDINIKEKYSPYTVNEDYLIETILVRAFNRGRLIKQEAVTPVDYDELTEFWEQKAKELKK